LYICTGLNCNALKMDNNLPLYIAVCIFLIGHRGESRQFNFNQLRKWTKNLADQIASIIEWVQRQKYMQIPLNIWSGLPSLTLICLLPPMFHQMKYRLLNQTFTLFCPYHPATVSITGNVKRIISLSKWKYRKGYMKGKSLTWS
jgi:hypothetical protein